MFTIAILVSTPSATAGDWMDALGVSIKKLTGLNASVWQLYVVPPRDAGPDQRYYRFLDRVHRELRRAAQSNGLTTVGSPLEASHYLETEFEVSQDSLTLFLSLKAAETRQVSASSDLKIESDALPPGWNQRSLQDVTFEMISKLEKELFGQRLRVVVGEFSGGTSESSGLVSEFSQLVRENVLEELGKLEMFQIVPYEAIGSADYELTGRFSVSDNEIIFRVRAVRRHDKRELANVSSRFSVRIVPSSVAIFPENKVVVEPTVDKPLSSEVSDPDDAQMKVLMWVNHDDRTYRHDDSLIIYLKANVDLYARVYYVQSDGSICQILPHSSRTGRLEKNRTYPIGEVGSGVGLTIDDTTTQGQETIKVFASLGQIDDSHLPKAFHAGQRLNCDVRDYNDLKEGITRGLKLEYTVRPVAEVKILVTKRDK